MLNVDKYRDELIKEMKCRKENLDDCVATLEGEQV